MYVLHEGQHSLHQLQPARPSHGTKTNKLRLAGPDPQIAAFAAGTLPRDLIFPGDQGSGFTLGTFRWVQGFASSSPSGTNKVKF